MKDNAAPTRSVAPVASVKAGMFQLLTASSISRQGGCLGAVLFLVIPSVHRPLAVFVDDTRIEIVRGPGPWVIPVNCGQVVRASRTGPSSPYYAILCREGYLSLLGDELYGRGTFHFSPARRPAPRELLTDLRRLEEVGRGNGSYDTFLAERIEDLVAVELLACLAPSGGWTSVRGPHNADVQRACALMRRRYGDALTMETLSGEACMSPSRFFAAFKAERGCTPHEFLCRVRIMEAIRLIEVGTAISTVSKAVGFLSMSGFEEAFERSTGTSPSDFRRCRERLPSSVHSRRLGVGADHRLGTVTSDGARNA